MHRSQRTAYALGAAIANARGDRAPARLFDSRDIASFRFHIVYTDRAGNTQTGRVSISAAAGTSAAQRRAKALQAAGWKYPDARRATIRAVSIRGNGLTDSR